MNDDLETLAAEYVLGTLPAAERARFSGRLQTDPAARRAVSSWDQRLDPLAQAIPSEAPSPGVWNGIESRLADAFSVPHADGAFVQGGGRLALWRGIALGSAAIAAMSLAWIFVAMPLAPPADPAGSRYVAVVDTGGREPALIAEVDTGTGIIRVRSLSAEAPQGHSLELWHVAEGHAPRSLGILNAGLTAQSIQDQPSAGPVEGQIAVTVEPAGGSPSGAPTGPIVYSGRLVPMGD